MYNSSNIHLNTTIPIEYKNVLQSECIDDNTLLHIKNTHENTSLNTTQPGRKVGVLDTSNVQKLNKLNSLLNNKLYLLVW